ncbi:FUSC family protein [Microbacterium pumilum]
MTKVASVRISQSLRAVVRDLTRIGPHNNAHAPAIRLGISTLAPALLLLSLGRDDLIPYALLASTVAVYGRASNRWSRVRMQAQAASAIVLAITLGAIVAGAPSWVLVCGAAMTAGVTTLLSDRLRWAPGGALFPTFSFGVASSISGADIGTIVITAVLAAAFALSMAAVASARNPSGNAHVPASPTPSSRVSITHATVCMVGGLLSGLLAVMLGFPNPYWAVVAAVVPIVGMYSAAQLLRAVHRLVGTAVGLLIALVLSAFSLSPIATLLVIAALLVGTELVIARNYSLAMLFVTPAIIEMSLLGVERYPVAELLQARLWETIMGVCIATLLVGATHRVRHPRGSSDSRRRGS